MSKLKTPTFKKYDQIRLKHNRNCYLKGDTKTVLVKPSYILTYVNGNINQYYFKISFNKADGDIDSAKNGQVIRISRYCFEALGFREVKNDLIIKK